MTRSIEKVGSITARGGRVRICRKRTLTSVLLLPSGQPLPRDTDLVCLGRDELVWFGADDDWHEPAPSSRHAIIPNLAPRGVLDWQRRI